MKPKYIFHYGNTENMEELAQQCASSMHLSSTAGRLIKYYATCKTGFRPSKKTIVSSTNISPQSIYNAKDKLCKEGIIVDTEQCICVNWDRIRLFASLNPKLTGRNHKVARCIPPNHILMKFDEYDLYFPCKSEDAWINFFQNISQQEYEAWIRAKSAYERRQEIIMLPILPYPIAYLPYANHVPTNEELDRDFGFMFEEGRYIKENIPF